MQTMNWLEPRVGSIEKAIETLNNDFCWSITVEERNGIWFVNGGDHVILSSDARDAVNAFLYGMALSLRCLPFYDQAVNDLKRWCDDLEQTHHADEG